MRIAAIAQYSYFVGGNRAKSSPPVFGEANHKTLSPEAQEQIVDLQVFNHHIYEYEKGLRHLILTTEKAKHRETIERKLQHRNIPYLIHKIDRDKINVFFGDEACINVVKTFSPKLNRLTAEQDFILGIMLGYDRVKQCDRYLKIKNQEIKLRTPEE